MGRFQTLDYEIPESMQRSWQDIVNLLAKIADVPTTLIMRVHQNHIEVNTSSDTQGNPYKAGDKEDLGHGLYCEHVIETKSQLVVPDALADEKWSNNPDIKLGMLSYCGLPLFWPNGETFGTICMLDSKANEYSETYRQLLNTFKDSIEAQLAVVYQQYKLLRLNSELKNRVENRTTDLAQLSFSLTQEIDRRKAAERQVNYQKTHDQGTGFLNRAALEAVVEDTLQCLEHGHQSLIIINVGFSNARSIQTRYGFEAFDEILKEFRKRLGTNDSDYFITGRPSSNDLVLLLWGEDADSKLHNLLDKITNISVGNFYINDTEVHLHSYVGVVQAHRSSSAKQLLQNACYAMLLCKESGEAYSYFCESHTHELNNHNQLESYLLQAVRNDDLMLYFQPKVNPHTHKWIGAEALLRWRHPVLGDVSNEALIHMAEQNGLIFEVGSFVLRTAIDKAKQWSELFDNFKVAVNVSPIQLQNVNFAEQVEHLLEAFHLPARFLELEVTESALIADEVVARTTLKKLNKLGVTLSLDDFGTGYASFSYLKKYPFDAIKIDKSFVQQMEKSDDDRAIICSIIHIAKKLELQVVIEGIESPQQEQFLIGEGCDIGQGFLYGKPMPCNEFEQSLFNQRQIGGQYAYSS
ncbi:GGDEF and EAL domain-containing protein [Vibrio parahaemolyticus]|uniref:sensor domain-containing phosphodiesterase n=1 Tax=Vibrio parahaemolyticus TaxID=670 RepID=UPI0006B292CB|nr:GGDEF and EAL domain-containing protein [Vibrio parahaemolyticus]EGQ7821945.1 GGDEF and EAL domain-containing protein [Vibrio parahaemolyticus]EGQ9519608.1 GGDEF and EAL domain-containing protein [Vibrio parahaemolyticus]EGR0907112.1 GGDEF domain-containing protein [Vibrio parahaemolyticus]EGV3807529.1 GGDEF domain-containing protein [Vibrio parahaemolyticus]EIA1588623.1 GGDEF and EAL domain-containing protein [Vibrio parahaemolyticus]